MAIKRKTRTAPRRRRTTAAAPRRTSIRRRRLAAGFSGAKLKKGVNVAVQGAIGGGLATLADKYLPPLVGLTPGQGYGALFGAVLVSAFTGRENIAAGMAGAGGALMAQSFGLADGYLSGISSLNPGQARSLLTAGAGLSELADNGSRQVAPAYGMNLSVL